MMLAQEVRWVEENLRTAMSCFARSKPGGEALDLPGLRLVHSGVPQAVFNAVLLNEPVTAASDLRRRIERAHDYFRRRNLPWSLWLCEDLVDPAELKASLVVIGESGLLYLSNPPGMLAERLQPPRRELPELEYRAIRDAATRIDFCHVMSMAFEGPFRLLLDAYNSDEFWQDGFEGFVGYAQGRAVTTACTVCDRHAVGVYAVSTAPHQQRKGYGEAIMRHAISHAYTTHGLERTVLQSSPAGLPLYHLLGYRIVSVFSIYVSV